MDRSKSARELALQILTQLNTGHGRARDILNRVIRDYGIAEPDKSFLSELVYGTLRRRGNLDWILGQFIHPRRLKKLRPEIVEILRLGLYQLLFLKNVPDHAAVNESVEMSKGYGYKGVSKLVNAVLRRAIQSRGTIPYPDICTNPAAHISARYSHPEWLVKRWLERYGISETIKLCSANNIRPPLYIRTNPLKASREQLIQSLQSEGALVMESVALPESIRLLESPLPIDKLSSYKLGWFQVQDGSSMLVSHILDPKPAETVIDICAAPGGKTTHIAELMQNTGRILAFDTDERRLPLISENCQRLGITIVEPIQADARNLDKHLSGKTVDRVLVDVPCTGLGVLRRRIETRWRRTPDQLETFPKLQYEILASAARHVKPGGVLVYCTCTIEPEENHQVVDRFLDAHPQFRVKIPFLEIAGEEGLAIARGLVSLEGHIQTYPHRHDMDGIFAVRMVRTKME